MKNFATLIKFGFTGVVATAIHMLVVYVLVGLLAWPVTISNGLAFFAATLFSNYVNTVWSFASTMSRQVVVRFWSVALLGCALAMLIASAMEKAGYHYAIGVLAIAMTVPLISFVLHKFWTYR